MNSNIITLKELPIRLREAFESFDAMDVTDVQIPNVTGLNPDEAAYYRIGTIIGMLVEQRYPDAIRTIVALLAVLQKTQECPFPDPIRGSLEEDRQGQSSPSEGAGFIAPLIQNRMIGFDYITEDVRVFYSRANQQILLGVLTDVNVGYQPESFVPWCLDALLNITLFCIMHCIALPSVPYVAMASQPADPSHQ